MARRFNYAGIAVLAFLFAVNVYRAWSQSIAHDEAYTYHAYLSGTFASLFNQYDANHHFLYTLLAKLSVSLFGVSEFSMRLPSLLSGALYFWSVYRLSFFLFGESVYSLLSVLVLSMNPLVLDFLVAARGYGLALALFFYAFAECLAYLDAAVQAPGRAPERVTLYGPAIAIALSVAANLVFLFPLMIFAFLFLAALGRKRLRDGLLGFAAPAAAVLLIFFVTAPFAKASKGIFYVGTSSLQESLRSFVEYSFAHNPGLWGLNLSHVIFSMWRSAVFVIVPATILIVGWLWFIVCAKEWRSAGRYLPGRAEMVVYLSFGTSAGAVLLAVAGHYLLDLPYPEGRTGIYLLPLFVLASMGALQMLRVGAAFRQAIAWGLTAVLVISVADFAIEFNTKRFAVWLYDADTKAIVQAIAAREAHSTGPLRLGASWPLAPSINFYRVILKLDRIQAVNRLGPRGDFDYYVLAERDTSLAGTQHLTTLREYPVSGVVLAMR